MLSSLILSLAVSASPVPQTDVVGLEVNQTGTKRGAVRIDNSKLIIEKTGTKRGAVRIDNSKLIIEKTGTKRGAVRL